MIIGYKDSRNLILMQNYSPYVHSHKILLLHLQQYNDQCHAEHKELRNPIQNT